MEIKERLKALLELEPLDQEDKLQEISKETGKTIIVLKKQLNLYKKEKIKEEPKNFALDNFEDKLGIAFDKKGLAEHIIEFQPCYYDKSRSWWLWNWPQTKWERVDEVDILNAIEKQGNINTINSKERTEMLEALKQVSRRKENTPVPVGDAWIQFKNQIMDIRTGKTFRASPTYFVTNPIPWDLSKDNYTETPTMDRIFEEWVGKDNVKTLYEIMAYCMLSSYPIHRIFCFIGEGLNGKSCFLNLLKMFIGEDNCCSTELDTLLNSRFEVTRLHKKLVCQMGETNFSEMNKTSLLKKLSGGDLIGFEYKNKDPFEDVNYAKILIATNNLPATTDKTKGFYRRWMIIDFPNSFSEKVDILDSIPSEEFESLALKCTFILKDLIETREFTNEGSIEDRMKKYEDKSNPLEKFMKERVIEDFNGSIWKWEFKKELDDWCKQNRFREMSDVVIGKKMKELDIRQEQRIAADFDQGRKWRAWVGIKWKGGNLEQEEQE